MIPWSGIPFLRFTIAFSSGIACYFLLSWDLPLILICGLFFFLYLVLFLVQKYQRIFFYALQPWLGAIACIFFFFLGSLLASIRDEKNNQDHLLNYQERIEFYSGYVSSQEEQKEKFRKVTLAVEKVYSNGQWNPLKGEVLIYVPSDADPLPYGTVLMIKGSPEVVPGPANPGEFDYQAYLRYHHIYLRHFLKKESYRMLPLNNGNPVLIFSYSLRTHFDRILKDFIQGEEEYKIASALLLGIRSGLSDEIKEAYTSTGTMHVLAISGLHVAVVFQLLMSVFIFVPQGSFKNRLIIFVSLILFLWLFALVTGFSPSVLRAVFMFSVILLAKLIRKNTNIYNTLFFAAFCLLLYDPMMIADVGFQLSFLAVLGIVYFSDRIYYLKQFNNRFLNYVWRVSSVSIAAQLAVLPLSLYYFHQIPLYFLLANLIVIPLSSLILYAGIFLLMISWIPVLNEVTGWVITKGIWFMNEIILLIGKMPSVVIKDIYITPVQLFFLYIFLIVLSAFFFYKKLRYLKVALVSVFLLSSIQIYGSVHKQGPEMVIFYIKNHLAVAFKDKHQAVLLVDSALMKDKNQIEWSIKPYLNEEGVTEIDVVSPDDRKENSFIKILSEDAYLLLFHSRKIVLSFSSASIESFDYKIEAKRSSRGIKEVLVYGSESDLIYSSLRDQKYKIIKP